MPISALRITNFRNMGSVEIFPASTGLNVISGDNGSGKTSLLEAIYYLGHGRSFRSSNANRLIKHHSDKFSVYTQLLNDERTIAIGIERNKKGESQQRIAEQNVSVAELAAYLPIRIINTQSHLLFEAGPQYRRRYLDWGLFYQFNNFFACWRNFERVLKQRNVILRDNRPRRELGVWSEELVKYATEFTDLRRQYVQELAPILSQMAGELLAINELEICYLPGWDESLEYDIALADNVALDYGYGYTQLGPHRADLDLRINGLSVKHFLSRGQQKLLICAMIIAQGKLLFQHINKGLIYLIDDLPAELDLQSKTNLIALLSRQQTQVFITAIESNLICNLNSTGDSQKVFHVEHGVIRSIAGQASEEILQ